MTTAVSPGPFGVEHLLAHAREGLARVTPCEAAALREHGARIVDVRPHADRDAEGEIPDALAVERIVLEWRLDPSGSHRLDWVRPGSTVIVVCNEGYASSLAAAALRELGLAATDLDGGFRAWAAEGLPVVAGPSDPVR